MFRVRVCDDVIVGVVRAELELCNDCNHMSSQQLATSMPTRSLENKKNNQAQRTRTCFSALQRGPKRRCSWERSALLLRSGPVSSRADVSCSSSSPSMANRTLSVDGGVNNDRFGSHRGPRPGMDRVLEISFTKSGGVEGDVILENDIVAGGDGGYCMGNGEADRSQDLSGLPFLKERTFCLSHCSFTS